MVPFALCMVALASVCSWLSLDTQLLKPPRAVAVTIAVVYNLTVHVYKIWYIVYEVILSNFSKVKSFIKWPTILIIDNCFKLLSSFCCICAGLWWSLCAVDVVSVCGCSAVRVQLLWPSCAVLQPLRLVALASTLGCLSLCARLLQPMCSVASAFGLSCFNLCAWLLQPSPMVALASVRGCFGFCMRLLQPPQAGAWAATYGYCSIKL